MPRKFLCLLAMASLLFLSSPAQAATFEDEGYLGKELENIRTQYGIPGMSAAIVVDGQIYDTAVAGVRKYGASEAVESDDAFHIGSIAKPITATLAYILSEKKILPITTKISDVFPELKKKMRPEYKNVTVEMLLTHMGGFPYQPLTEGADEFSLISQDMKKRRYEYVKAALKDAPEGPVGSTYVYSGGTIIAASMMEKKTGKTWEQLVQKYVFSPLGMSTAGFGSMSDADQVTGVWEHDLVDSVPVPVTPDPAYSKEPHAPAGRNVHMSAEDLARFLISSLPYSKNSTKLLSRSSLLKMEKQVWNGSTSPGWFVANEQWSDWQTIYHDGDNNRSISALVFSPKYESGYVIMANVAGEQAWAGVHKMEDELKSYLQTKNLEIQPPQLDTTNALSVGQSVTASNVYASMSDYGPEKAVDGSYETRWATDDGVKDAWIEVDLGKLTTVKKILIKEEFAPRVSYFSVVAKNNPEDKGKKVAEGKEIGNELMITPKVFKARFVRLNVKVKGDAGPTISEFELFSK